MSIFLSVVKTSAAKAHASARVGRSLPCARRLWTLRLAEPAHPMAERLLGAVYFCVGVVGCAPTVVVEFLSHEPEPQTRPNGRRCVAGPLFVADLSRQSIILKFTLGTTF